MAYLEMYNSDQHKGHCPPISPRISFSNDFADSSQQILKQEIRNNSSSSSSRSDVSSDFEFSVSNYSMMSADELFFKGRLLPFKNQTQRTIRDELLTGDDDDNDNEVSLRPPKGSGSSNRWKGLLGLKRTHIGSKKIDKILDNASPSDTRFRPDDHLHLPNNSQEFLSTSEGGSSHRDVEIGI